ncbi:DNA polymerase III subunit beta [Candidatus Parcubacteria bacterium]|nr:DNA polymerase III subunit beta [Candidatus Parcubacteria bacterium]
MNLIILKENLKRGLDIVERITGKNLTLPILNNVLISVKKNLLKLSTTDLEVGINYWTLTKTEKEGKITVPAKLILSLVNSLPNKKITLEEKDQVLNINCDNYNVKIKGQSPDDFPIIPKTETTDFIEINSIPFYKGISQVVEFSSLNQTKPEISGIYFNLQKNALKIVATDSFRLAEKTLYFKDGMDIKKETSFIIPQRTARELINITSEREDKLKMYLSSSQVLFELSFPEGNQPQIQLVSRLIEGKYPNYQEIIPQKYETQVVVSRDELISQIKTTSLFSGKTNEIKINVNVNKNKMELFAQTPEIGENKSEILVKAEGKNTETSFNFKFLLDGLTNIKSDEVIFGINGIEGPAILKPVGDTSYLYVVMPIKGN